MKKVINWNTTSSRGVRFGSALSSVLNWADTARSPGGRRAWGSGGLGGLGRRDQRVDRPVGYAGGLDGHLRDAVAEEGEEEDGGHRQRHAFERDEQGHRDPHRHPLGPGLGASGHRDLL